MAWIVLGEDKGKIKLVSKRPVSGELGGILPKGSFLTIDEGPTKFILRVDDSIQYEPYQPSPLIIDMELSGLAEDSMCQNIVHAYRIKDITTRTDGKIDFIRPQSVARRSNQEEIDLALDSIKVGPRVFLSTVHAGKNQLLMDDNQNLITAQLPEEMFFHQMQLCGKTGSGKTVAMKYLAQYFVEKMEGAVLAINVKDVDFLRMDQPSAVINPQIKEEWKMLGSAEHGINSTVIYYPATTRIDSYLGVNPEVCEAITLSVEEVEPEALTGLLHNITEIGAQSLPDIFRYWKDDVKKKNDTFNAFVNYFQEKAEERVFDVLNVRGDQSRIPLHRGTYDNILRSLHAASEFFDNEEAKSLNENDILANGKMSIVNVAGHKGVQFGAVLLRHLLKKIVEAKSQRRSDVAVLVIIDEVHQFYNTEASREALGDLDTICRTGRSQKIGVIFASQNENDIPRGLSSVINTRIFFRSDISSKGLFGVSSDEILTLKAGFAVASFHDLAQLKIVKFPVSFAGVFEEEK